MSLNDDTNAQLNFKIFSSILGLNILATFFIAFFIYLLAFIETIINVSNINPPII